MVNPAPTAKSTAASVGRLQRVERCSYVPSKENARSVPKNRPDETGAASATKAAAAASADIPNARRCEGVDGELRGGSEIIGPDNLSQNLTRCNPGEPARENIGSRPLKAVL